MAMTETDLSELGEMSMNDTPDLPDPATCRHEAAHCVVARLTGLRIVSATAQPPKPVVRTLHRRFIDLEKEILTSLAGVAMDTDAWAIEQDLQIAMRDAEQLVLHRHGMAEDSKLTLELRKEATALVERLRPEAAELVAQHQGEIDRVGQCSHERRDIGSTSRR
jgi:hypothetical protein